MKQIRLTKAGADIYDPGLNESDFNPHRSKLNVTVRVGGEGEPIVYALRDGRVLASSAVELESLVRLGLLEITELDIFYNESSGTVSARVWKEVDKFRDENK